MKTLFVAVPLLWLVACTDDKSSSSCSGSVLGCSWANLSSAQETEACDLITASIDSPAGTKFECASGPNMGLSLTVENSATCVSHSYPPNCPVTVQQTLDCFKAARADACSAFDDTGSCGKLLAATAQCQ